MGAVSLRDDVILRVIHQLVEALLRAMNLRRKRDLPGAEQAIGDGLDQLGLSLDVVTRLDPHTLKGLLGDKRVLVGAALVELARVREAEGGPGDPRAAALRDTAKVLLEGMDVPDELAPVLSPAREDARMPW